MSTAGSRQRARRKLSRINRLSRLRSTERRRCRFDRARPSLAWPPRETQVKTTKQESTDFWGPSNTLRKAAACRSLASGGNRPVPASATATPSGDQTRPAFCSPFLEHLLAVSRSHAGAKAVGTGSLDATGLESSLHDLCPLWAAMLEKPAGKKAVRVISCVPRVKKRGPWRRRPGLWISRGKRSRLTEPLSAEPVHCAPQTMPLGGGGTGWPVPLRSRCGQSPSEDLARRSRPPLRSRELHDGVTGELTRNSCPF